MSFDPLFDDREPIPYFLVCPGCPHGTPCQPDCDDCREDTEIYFDPRQLIASHLIGGV